MEHDLGKGMLVLGSTGFIGAHLVRRLEVLGYNVYAMSRSEEPGTSGRLTRIRGSIDDLALIRDLVARCGSIIHTASLTTPSASASAPLMETGGNLNALAQVLSLANEFPRRRLIYLSSAGAVYGDSALNVDENAALRPRSYYGAGKAAAEAFIHACVATTSWDGLVIRPSNIYGPGQTATKGFAIIPTLLSCALHGKTFTIWGDGRTVRDYCHVDDVVDLIVKAVEEDGAERHAVYNAASGQTSSILELIALCEQTTGRRISIEFQPGRSVDVPHVSLNSDAAHSAYGWKARISLPEGLDKTWQWFSETHRL